MALTVLLGGARSGKTALALRLARRSGRPVTYVATGQAGDDEMADRIAQHRTERPSHWDTVEDPMLGVDQLAAVDPARLLVVDCLTLWVSNLLLHPDQEILARAGTVAALLANRPAGAVVVSNEVGSGIVPGDSLTRRYRDLLGRVNTTFTTAADSALLVVAGRVLELREL